MYLYVERIRDFFGLCAIQIYFLLTYLLTRPKTRRQRCRDREAGGVEGVGNGEGLSPPQPTVEVWGSVVSSTARSKNEFWRILSVTERLWWKKNQCFHKAFLLAALTDYDCSTYLRCKKLPLIRRLRDNSNIGLGLPNCGSKIFIKVV